jgi:hypothetical protein
MNSLMAATRLLKGVELTPGQMAELRAIKSLYYSRLASSELAREASGSNPSDTVLHDLVLGRVRDMLRGDQLIIFERNLATLESDEARDGAGSVRHP